MNVDDGDWVSDGDDRYAEAGGQGGAYDADRSSIVGVDWSPNRIEGVVGSIAGLLDRLR
jgi:hypothetical protein